MIVCDTNILSTFARVGVLKLLFKLFPKHEFVIPKAVYEEIMEAVRYGATFLYSVLALVDSGQIRLLSLTPEEERDKSTLPQSFGPGELEGVVICARRRSIFLTNDKRVRNYCQEHRIEVYDLVLLLRTLWRKGAVSRKKVQKIVSDIERLEKIVFKNKSDIFKK
jgi:predicted nucleic acid-binding protein